jgi:hypothetical protein
MKHNIIHLILNHSIHNLNEEDCTEIKQHYNSIRKGSNKIIDNIRKKLSAPKKKELFSLLGVLDLKSNALNRMSYEMFVIITIDYLLNVEREMNSRIKFSYINTTKYLDNIMEKYPVELKEHYKFFESLIDIIEKKYK